MVPYGIVRGKINNQIPVSLEDLSIYGFTFRVDERIEVDTIEVLLYLKKEDRFHSFQINHFEIEIEEENEFYIRYRIAFEDLSYQSCFKQVMKEYKDYIAFKQSGKDLIDQRKGNIEKQQRIDFSSVKHIGVVIEDVEAYLADPNYLSHYPFEVEYLYLGSQSCIHLLPSISTIQQISFKNLVLMLPPIPTSYFQKLEAYLDRLENRIEIVVNDLGTLQLLQKYDFPITLGIHLLKHLKDPRIDCLKIHYKKNTLPDQALYYYQNKMKVRRFSYECFEEVKLNEQFDLYLPYYTTNVATYCLMHAQFTHTKAKKVEACEKYCLKHRYDALLEQNILGKNNQIVGINQRSLVDLDYVLSYQSGRIVINNEINGWNEFD